MEDWELDKVMQLFFGSLPGLIFVGVFRYEKVI